MKNATAPLPRTLLDALADAGVNLDAAAAAVGIEPASRLETGLSAAQADQFLVHIWRTVGQPAMGLHAGVNVRPERFGISGLTAMMAKDLRGALKLKGRYNRLIWGDLYELHEDGGLLTVTARVADSTRPYSAAKIDLEFSSLIAFGRYFTRVPIVPVSLSLMQAAPVYRDEYLRLLGVAPLFGQAQNAFQIRSCDADLALVSANTPAMAALQSIAEAQLEGLQDASFGTSVRRALATSLNGSEPVLIDIARQLHVSARTLQRKLAADGLSFSRLLDEVRREYALQRLRGGSFHLAELAYMLGFVDTNSFYRAFRRWTGTTPEKYRQSGA
ncbi:MAG: AraC family transcriptional regulator ligand-binding domain-containing protein [Pseudomonadota bacterium]